MAGAISLVDVKDGNNTLLVGKVRMFDVSGAGTGPWVPVALLYDPVSGQVGTIKAASTAAAATDPALVVGLSPNGLNTNGAKPSSNSAPSVLASDQATLAVAPDTSGMMNGSTGVVLTPKFHTIVASSSGATTIVALVAAKKIRVLALKVVANAAVNIKWQSHVTPTDLTGLSYCGAQGDGEVLPFNPVGWFETIAGEALDINLSGAVAVGGHLTYIEV